MIDGGTGCKELCGPSFIANSVRMISISTIRSLETEQLNSLNPTKFSLFCSLLVSFFLKYSISVSTGLNAMLISHRSKPHPKEDVRSTVISQHRRSFEYCPSVKRCSTPPAQFSSHFPSISVRYPGPETPH
jgi:hypothetical protein